MWTVTLALSLLCLTGCAAQMPQQPAEASALEAWLAQADVQPRQLQITPWPADSGRQAGWPLRLTFDVDTPADPENWRLTLRDGLGAWFDEQGHPEGLCTSVDLTPEGAITHVDVQIVCR